MRPLRAIAPIVALVIVTSVYLPADFATAQSASLTGQVCTGEGETACVGPGLRGANVTLTGLLGIASYEATTGERGGFAIDADDGDYDIRVERTGFEAYEGTITVDGETTITVGLQGARVTPTITVDGEGDAPTGVATFEGHQEGAATEFEEGAFEISLTAGWYEIGIDAKGYQPGYWSRLVDGSAMSFFLESEPERTAVLKGTVLDKDGEPVADANVNAWQCCYAYPEHYHEQEAADGGSMEGADGDEPRGATPMSIRPYGGDARATTDKDGRFTVYLYPGDVEINLYRDGYASKYTSMDVQDGDNDATFTMQKYPAKTAILEGRVVDADGKAVRYASISIQYPEFGAYACSQEGSRGEMEPASDVAIAPGEPYPAQYGCDITVASDGSFTGKVMPGYAILSVWIDSYRACPETQDADGSYSRVCGPEYQRWVRTMDLPADQTTSLTVTVSQQPGPDATIGGWILDEDDEPIQGARIHFSRADGYGYGWATTDADGSYKIRVRSGLQYVNVWADGYLNWEGMVTVQAGQDAIFTVNLREGETGGYCCYAYETRAVAEDDAIGDAAVERTPGAPGAPTSPQAISADGAQEGGDATADYEDLGGGLGPYDPTRGSSVASGNDTPYAPVGLVLGLLAAVAIWRRR